MHCIFLVGSMAVGLDLSGVGLVDESFEINLGEFFICVRVFNVGNLQKLAISSLLEGKCLDHNIIC